MTHAIIGAGPIGQALATAFARKGLPVILASRRPPAELAPIAAAIGPLVQPATLAQAAQADIAFLAVPYAAHAEVAAAADWRGRVIIDVTNAYGTPAEMLGNRPPSAVVASAFAGAKLVKGFNHLPARKLASDPAVNGGRRVVFLAGEDDGAIATVAALAETLGFAPIPLGGLSEGGTLVQGVGDVWGKLIFKDLVSFA